MNTSKYIGMDVHMATTVIAVVNSVGGTVAEAVVETKPSTLLDFLKSQRGTVHVTFEEGTQAAWLHDLIRPHVAEVVVCNPREIPAQDNKADRSDAKRLAELLRTQRLKAVYHGEHGTQALKELSRSYGAILSDSTRVKNRLKGVFRGRGISCTGTTVYSKKGREQWLKKLDDSAVRSLNYPEMVRLLLDYGADFSLKDVFNDTALSRAAKNGSMKTARILIEAGADTKWRSPAGTLMDIVPPAHKKELEALLHHRRGRP